MTKHKKKFHGTPAVVNTVNFCGEEHRVIEMPQRGFSKSPNIAIPCKVCNRYIMLYWMHGKPPFFICRNAVNGYSDEEYVCVMQLKDIQYGQVCVCNSEEAPYWIMKWGLNTCSRMDMLTFCINNAAYRRFRLHIRDRAWDIINGIEGYDLTVLRLATTFFDFVESPCVSELLDSDRGVLQNRLQAKEDEIKRRYYEG